MLILSHSTFSAKYAMRMHLITHLHKTFVAKIVGLYMNDLTSHVYMRLCNITGVYIYIYEK